MRFCFHGSHGILLSSLIVFSTFSFPLFAEEDTGTPPPPEVVQESPKAKPVLKYLGTPIPVGRDDVTLRFGLHDAREKFMLLKNFNFDSASDETSYVNLLRFYPNIELKAGPYVTVFAEMLSAESFSNSACYKTSSFVDYVDLNQLYAEIKSPYREVPLSVKVGRQSLAYGDERLIGEYNISNVMQVFDAAKLIYEPTNKIRVDAWMSHPVVKRKSLPDTSDNSRWFHGIYSTMKPMTDHVFDLYFLMLYDTDQSLVSEKAGRTGPASEYTPGTRFKGKWKNLDYGTEWTGQFGSRAHDDILAWMWHNEVGYTLSKVPWKPRASFAYDHGSGDNNTSDGKCKDFDALFPSDALYAYTDLVGIRNQNHFSIGGEVRPNSKLFFSVTEHFYFLDSNKSDLFNADQGVVRATAPNASRTVGKETDIFMNFTVNSHVDGYLGYSYFCAGPFFRDTGAHDNPQFYYVALHVHI